MTNPPSPLLSASQIVGAVNYDGLNVYGETKDIVIIGAGVNPALDAVLKSAASDEGLMLTPDPTPSQGHFFRSDQWPFALRGIPAVNPSLGNKFVNKPSSYYESVTTDYNENRYHQPTDMYNSSWDLGGAIQQIRVSLRIVYYFANTDSNLALIRTYFL